MGRRGAAGWREWGALRWPGGDAEGPVALPWRRERAWRGRVGPGGRGGAGAGAVQPYGGTAGGVLRTSWLPDPPHDNHRSLKNPNGGRL